MKTIESKVEGDVVLHEDTTLRGMVIGGVAVDPGVHFVLRGMIVGDLTLKDGSKTELHGMVKGNVLNNGGSLKVYGMVIGSIEGTGQTTVDPRAVVRRH